MQVRLEGCLRNLHDFKLRKARNSYQEIAGELGLKAKSRAYELVMEGLGNLESMSKKRRRKCAGWNSNAWMQST